MYNKILSLAKEIGVQVTEVDTIQEAKNGITYNLEAGFWLNQEEEVCVSGSNETEFETSFKNVVNEYFKKVEAQKKEYEEVYVMYCEIEKECLLQYEALSIVAEHFQMDIELVSKILKMNMDPHKVA